MRQNSSIQFHVLTATWDYSCAYLKINRFDELSSTNRPFAKGLF